MIKVFSIPALRISGTSQEGSKFSASHDRQFYDLLVFEDLDYLHSFTLCNLGHAISRFNPCHYSAGEPKAISAAPPGCSSYLILIRLFFPALFLCSGDGPFLF